MFDLHVIGKPKARGPAFRPPEVFRLRTGGGLPATATALRQHIRGSSSFSFPIPDLNPNTPDKDAKWQYALDSDANQHDAGIAIERRPMPSHWDWQLDAPVILQVPARTFDWQPTDENALPDRPVAGARSETVQLIPYGCTKFRVSMFPVTPRAWQQ